MFLKPVSALAGPDDLIVYPAQSSCVDYEAELAVVIRRRCRDVPVARAREYVLGYGASTTSPRATCASTPGSGRVPRGSTPSVPSAPSPPAPPRARGACSPVITWKVRIDGIGSLRNPVVKL